MVDIFSVLASEEAKKVLGPILDQIEAIDKQISEIRQRTGRPTLWLKDEEYKRLSAAKETLQQQYESEKERLIQEAEAQE